MSLRFLYIVCLLSPNILLQAQPLLKGKIVRTDNLAPIAGASIYINNTSIGTSSAEDGSFSISNPVNGELIISDVNYERIIIKLVVNEIPGKKFLFKMSAREDLLENILVLPEATRRKYLDIFRKNFLGITQEADYSRITNLQAVNFIPGDAPGVIVAVSDTPLHIINKLLGYDIIFDLVNFSYNPKSGESSFYGYTRYKSLGDKSRWKKNRRHAYYGSALHFFRSLTVDRLSVEHFEMYLVKTDSLAQNKMDIAMKTTAQDIVKQDSVNHTYTLLFPEKLMVQYLREPAGKKYLSSKVMLSGSFPGGSRSYLIRNGGNIIIDTFGIVQDPMSLLYNGYWGYEKAANLLPYNYFPTE